MVTFSFPGDNDAASGNASTPRSRPPLPFAKRPFAASSPYGAAPGSAKRLSTPQGTPARRFLPNRDPLPTSSLNQSSIATARNIFRASTVSDSPPAAAAFSPKLPQNTMTKLFAPGNTPDPNRRFRDSTVQPTPRGMAAKTTDKELFAMRIESPPADLTGEALSAKVPKDWDSKTSIYADQFLSHLCPPDLDDEQKRQFFCILDLRRLKYAADEIFSKKDWKLNILNFAKEFEKSRGIILLHYGLYEFHNVKPSKEILRRWRREHGLPDPEEEDAQPTPSKSSATKKRKANDDLTDNAGSSLASGKRRATDKEQVDAPAVQPATNKNKRKASLSDESESQPAKLSKPTSSASAALFGQIAEKHKSTPSSTTTAKQAAESSVSKPNIFATKPTNGGLARSVFSNLKTGQSQAGSPSNIFGYLSDASSAKNSGVEADAESEADSDQDDSQEAGQSDEPSVAASGGAETASQIGFGLLSKQPAPASGLATASSSAPGTRESTPGPSLFDRVTKTSDGQLARANVTEPAATEQSESLDQTWNPSSTPIKFAPSNASKPGPAFGTSASAQPSSLFPPKSTASSNMFGAAKVEQPSDKVASKETTPATTDKEGNESDKENGGQAPKKSLFEAKTPSSQPNFGSSLFSTKPAAPEPAKEAETPKPASSLFSAAPVKSDGATPAASSALFGSSTKPATATPATSTPTPVMQSSTLFGANSSDTQTPADSVAPKPASLFATAPATSSETSAKPSASSLFAPKTTSNGGNLFSSASPATQSAFGAPSATTTAPEPEKKLASGASSQPASAPLFSFGASQPKDASQLSTKPLFGAPKSPPSGTATDSLFSGSPMKQDEPSPAKKTFTGASGSGSAPTFSFGNTQNQTSNMFGASSNATSAPSTGGPISFGGATSSAGTGGFNFNFGAGGASTSTVSNPFSAGNSGNDKPAPAATSTPGGMFSFGASSGPSAGGSASFQFGGASTASPAPSAGGSLFGGNQANSSAPAFGASSAGPPVFNFTSASPQPGQGNGSMFGSSTPAPAFGNLQPPAGGASTTGTNSPFSLGGGSSLATTPAGGTPEPTSQAEAAKEGAEEDGAEKEEQVNLTEGLEKDEEVVHEVRAKALKFVPAGEKAEGDDKPKSKSPWSTKGVGLLRILKHKETNAVRLLLRAEPRGHVAINRSLLPATAYKADEKYVRLTTANEKGDGLETWMLQVKTKDAAKDLAEAMEKHKVFNKKQ